MAQGEQLPEGTDHVINGAAATGSDVAERENEIVQSDVQSASGATEGEAGGGDQAGGDQAAGIKGQFRDRAQALKQQVGERAREYAEDGRGRATGALDSFAEAVNDAAGTVEERFGKDYADYARRAATSVQGLSDTLRDKDLDELYQDAVELVRKSPAIAVGTAAALGFALVRLAKAGLDDEPVRGGKAGGKSGAKRDTTSA